MSITLAALTVGAGSSQAAAGAEQRYPYDPACPWGRIADGHGMLVRCISQGEAVALTSNPPPQPLASTATAADRDAEAVPKVKDEEGSPPLEEEPKPVKLRVASIGSLKVDSGELPLAVKKLSVPKDRYTKCVEENGGLRAARGEVKLSFLVRERGRAEGVSVEKVSGMSKKAAVCIAHVVDRRYVGYPAAPVVGASIVVKIAKAE